jgi:hypothetical protein
MHPTNFARFATLVSALLPACNQLEALEGDSGGGSSVPPLVRQAFEESCGKSGCHAESGPTAPPLAGASLDNLIGSQYVTIGDLAASQIALQMLPDAGLAELGATRPNPLRMPLDGDFFNPNNYIILAWISGAEFEGGGGGLTSGGMEMTTTGDTNGTTGEPMPAEPTLTNVQSMVFDAACGCHFVAGSGGLVMPMGDTMATYTAIVDKMAIGAPTKKLVVPGSSADSYLYQKCVPAPDIVGGLMPLGGMLSQEQLDLLAAWIDAGAMND